jgi:hypothetical protein
MDLLEIERRLAIVISKASGWLPESQLDDMRSLNEAGEPGVALENLCVQLYEYDIQVSEEVWDELKLLGSAMGVKEDYWEILSKDTKS